MLVFTRKKDESIVINNNITLTVLEVLKDKVKLTIDAPKEVEYVRSEYHRDNTQKYKKFQALIESHEYQEANDLLHSLPQNSLYPTAQELYKLNEGLIKKI